MKLNRKWLLVIALLLSVAVATAGTLAYLTDADKDVNTMTLGSVYIVQNEQERNDQRKLVEFTQDKPLYPAVFEGSSIPWAEAETWPVPKNDGWKVVEDNDQVVDKFVTVSNIGKSDAYVRTIIAYEGDETYGPEGKYIHVVHNGKKTNPPINEVCHGVMEIGGVKYTVYSYTYPEALAPGATSIPSLKQIYMNKDADNDVVAVYGEKYDVIALSQAVQTAGFDTAEDALEAGFGEVTRDKLIEWLGETEVGSPNENYPDEGKNNTNNPPVPFAQVTILDKDDTLKLTKDDKEIIIVDANRTIDTDGTGSFGLKVGKIPLDVAYQFEPTMSEEEGKASEWAYWHADFVVSADKDIPAYGIGLAGFYDAWCSAINDNKWVLLTSPDVIPADTQIRLVEVMGGGRITVAYKDLCEFGNDGIGFLCGAVDMNGTEKMIDGKIPEALTPGTTLTVELRLYEVDENGNETGDDNYITAGVYTYTFD